MQRNDAASGALACLGQKLDERSQAHGPASLPTDRTAEPLDIWQPAICSKDISMGDVVWQHLTREQMVGIQEKAKAPDQPGARFMGEQVLMYHEWMGTDAHWHGVALLADGTQVVIEQRE
jgi:hypothetical protein